MDRDVVVFLIAMAVCFLCHGLCSYYNRCVEEKYGQGCINWFFSAVTAILSFVTYFFAEGEYYPISLLGTVIIWVIGICLTYRKMVLMGADTAEAVLSGLAQAVSFLGIAATILLVVLITSTGSRRRKRRRR